MKSRTFFLHLGVVQEKSAYCQESSHGTGCRYSHSEGSISCQTDCCNLLGCMSEVVLMGTGIQCVHLYCWFILSSLL